MVRVGFDLQMAESRQWVGQAMAGLDFTHNWCSGT